MYENLTMCKHYMLWFNSLILSVMSAILELTFFFVGRFAAMVRWSIPWGPSFLNFHS